MVDTFFVRFRPLPLRRAVSALATLLTLVAAGAAFAQDGVPAVPKGLPAIQHPKENPLTAAKIELGKQLYFDPRLSRDNTVSCATCHSPEKGYSNGEAVATGVGGKKGGRSAPSVINSAYYKLQFWDGRAGSLEEQALGPIQNPIEMNLTLPEAVEKIGAIPGYKKQFSDVFGTDVNADGMAKAIAAFERTILSGDAPYDRFVAGDKSALSEAAQRGLKLFSGKAHCSACHAGPNFSDNAFHNVGIGMHAKDHDVGRFAISKQGGDRGSFKTPTLREIAKTAPYMHDGSLKTLEEVVDHYAKGGTANDALDEEVYELKLSPEEKKDLVTFLKEGLTSESYPLIKAPELPK